MTPLAEILGRLVGLCRKGSPVRVRIEDNGYIAELVVRPSAQLRTVEATAPIVGGRAERAIPAGERIERGGLSGRLFSPIEESILGVVTREWQTRTQIAERSGMTVSSQFSAILTNLAEREWIESGHSGYRIPPAN